MFYGDAAIRNVLLRNGKGMARHGQQPPHGRSLCRVGMLSPTGAGERHVARRVVNGWELGRMDARYVWRGEGDPLFRSQRPLLTLAESHARC
jgi:hypothetical protein